VVSKELNDWLQVIGLFGVLGGLIFVGLQLRLDRQVASSEGALAINANRTAWAQVVTENADVWVRGLAGESLSAVEDAQFDVMARAYLSTYYAVWTRAADTISGENPSRFTMEVAIELHKHPGLLRYWRERQQSVMDEIRGSGLASGRYDAAVDAQLERLQVGASAD